MALLGILFLITGVIMNIQVLRRPYRGGQRRPSDPEQASAERLTAAEVMRSPPWLISAGLTAVGIALIVFFH
jgi:hypothetical protein